MHLEKNSPCKSRDISWEISLTIQDARTRSGEGRQENKTRPLVENEIETAASALQKKMAANVTL